MGRIQFGNRRAKVLCQLGRHARLRLIAEGLPVIHQSAKSLWEAAQQLNGHGRETTILRGLAEEEAAKALILLDIVRCPERCSSRIGFQVKWFYDHLARLLYADAQMWRPVNVSQLQEYLDGSRKGHYLEGYIGEYIVPNWNRYSRESQMYADIEVFENGNPHWSDPAHYDLIGVTFTPWAFELLNAFHALGLYELQSLILANEIWDSVEFKDQEHCQDNRQLAIALLDRMDHKGLIPATATDHHAFLFVDRWQLPMYNLDFREIEVPLEELEAEREAALWAEAGYHPAYG